MSEIFTFRMLGFRGMTGEVANQSLSEPSLLSLLVVSLRNLALHYQQGHNLVDFI
jgi:hypothetical protein